MTFRVEPFLLLWLITWVAVIVFLVGLVFGLWTSLDRWASRVCSWPELRSAPLTASVALPIV